MDRERCRKAGIPDAVGFASKPELARRILARALDNGVPGGWVTGDSVYGNNRSLRLWLEQRALPFVLAVPRHEPLWRQRLDCQHADAIADALPPEARQRFSAGPGSKDERWYDWAVTELVRLQLTEEEERWGYNLLIRRHCGKPDDRALYVVFAPRARATLATLVRVAGQRWDIKQDFQTAKGECGLDQYEVRRWTGWYRHITLALLAYALLAVMRQAAQKKAQPGVSGSPFRNCADC